MFGAAGAVLQPQQGGDDMLLVAAHVETVHVGFGQARIPRCEDDGLVAVRPEEGGVGRKERCRDEEVVEPFRTGGLKFAEGGEEFDLGRRGGLFENRPQPDTRQGVGDDDGYGGSGVHGHSWW